MQTILIGGMDRDIITGKRLNGPYDLQDNTAFYVKQKPVGLATSFNRSVWRAALPIYMGTKSFVEFWYGYPSSVQGNQGTGASDPTFATGSTNNTTAILTQLNNYSSSSWSNWGVLYHWNDNFIDSGESLPYGVLTLLVRVTRQDRVELWRDGVLKRTMMWGPLDLGTQGFMVGSFIEDAYWTSSSDMVLAGRSMTEPTYAELMEFGKNPWLLFDDGVETEEDAAARARRNALYLDGQGQLLQRLAGSAEKPVVLLPNGEIRQRSGSEGKPIVLVGDGLRTLMDSEDLVI